MKLVHGLPIYMVGGVIEYHPYLSVILSEKLGVELKAVEYPQHVVSYGAAAIARQSWQNQNKQQPAISAINE